MYYVLYSSKFLKITIFFFTFLNYTVLRICQILNIKFCLIVKKYVPLLYYNILIVQVTTFNDVILNPQFIT